MASAAFPGPTAVYREEQTFAPWVYAVPASAEAAVVVTLVWLYRTGHDPAHGGPGEALGFVTVAVAGLLLPTLVVLGLLRLTTEVTPVEVRVWFGWVPTFRHAVPLSRVRGVEVVRFRPVADHGGWGVRYGRHGERVFSARGDRGVRLTLADGSVLVLGSQRPEELAAAVGPPGRGGIG